MPAPAPLMPCCDARTRHRPAHSVPLRPNSAPRGWACAPFCRSSSQGCTQLECRWPTSCQRRRVRRGCLCAKKRGLRLPPKEPSASNAAVQPWRAVNDEDRQANVEVGVLVIDALVAVARGELGVSDSARASARQSRGARTARSLTPGQTALECSPGCRSSRTCAAAQWCARWSA